MAPGKTAPRLLQDLFTNCRHNLFTKSEQSLLPVPGEDPTSSTVYKVASYCIKCRWHVDILVNHRIDAAKVKSCGKETRTMPCTTFSTKEDDANSTARFEGSATAARRWEAAKQIAGDRADTSMARRVDAPDYLNTYLQDSLKPAKGKARIPLLNKKFLKTFDAKAKERETRSTNHEEDHPYYASLGAVGDFDDSLILFAFSRQGAVDIENKAYYFECLRDLATGRQSDMLGMRSSYAGFTGSYKNKREAERAYQYFGIDPTHASVIGDDHIIGCFRSRLADVSVIQAEEARKQLRVLGDVRER
ncbi:hypothetical protein AG0111_0g9386 [Alternaria gaisen]|uniref:Uncharacterized protein n=1 Tax=Alternaria gaisen TaxID=167740 RepID=A0ACB6FE16_9PLEO|nr:hypothetical protein AG0111_0g9386 [Alternaria gaisen]